MPQILFLTPAHPADGLHSVAVMQAYRHALAAHDVTVRTAPWTAPAEAGYDLVCPLLAWGYHKSPGAFIARMMAWASFGCRVANPVDMIAWNADKHYLGDLERAGIATIPTQFVEAISVEALDIAARAFGTASLVVKPVISAGADFTVVLGDGGDLQADLANAEARGALPAGEAMIQPFLPAIRDEGEWSLIFLGGRFSHAVLKTPKAGDFRSQPEFGAGTRSATPPAPALALAEAALGLPAVNRCVYARVDLVRDTTGDFRLMELELIEPDLYLEPAEGAPGRFAAALMAGLA